MYIQKRGILFLGVAAMSLALIASAATTSTLFPSAVGFYNSFTAFGTSTKYLNVDETTCNGLTDYNFTNTVGQRDSYGVSIASVPNGSRIDSVAIKPCASRISGGGSNPIMNVFFRLNGKNSADAGGYSLTGTTPVELATSTIATSSIKTSTTTLEIGAVYTSGSKGVRLSRISAAVNYTLFSAPTSLTVTAGTSTSISSIQLRWNDNTTLESGYRIERSIDGVSYAVIASTGIVSASSTTYTDTTVAPATLYYYRVYGYNAGGNSGYSNVASTTSNDILPTTPSGLFGVNATTSIYLYWNDNSNNEISFGIERSINSTTSFSQFATTSANTAFYTDTAVTGPNTYWYRVRAFGSVGYSGYSNITSVVLP